MISKENKYLPALLVPGRSEKGQDKLVNIIQQMDLEYSVCSDIYCLLEKILCCDRQEPILVVGELLELSRERMRLFDILSKRPAIHCICLTSSSPSRQQTQQIRTAIRAGALVADDSRELKKMIGEFVISRHENNRAADAVKKRNPERRILSTDESTLSPEEIKALLGE